MPLSEEIRVHNIPRRPVYFADSARYITLVSTKTNTLHTSNMARLGIKEAFSEYGATLRNVQWSVSAWAPDGSLVVSLWAHHYRRGSIGTAEYAATTDRWDGPGKNEFKENVERAFREQSKVRLVVVTTLETKYVEAGNDASQIKKDFGVRPDLIGQVSYFDGSNYVFSFSRA